MRCCLNTIFLQSHYYFTPNEGVWDGSDGVHQNTLDLAVKCATENKVFNFAARNNFIVSEAIIVSGSKTSSTKIALNMEAEDGLKWSRDTYASYYETECKKMKTPFLSNKCPFVFYAGSHNGISLRVFIKQSKGSILMAAVFCRKQVEIEALNFFQRLDFKITQYTAGRPWLQPVPAYKNPWARNGYFPSPA